MPAKENTFSTGGAWAAILAAGIGCFTFGLLADLSESSKKVSGFLNIYHPTGDLSGKSTGAVVIWLIAWAILHYTWKNKAPKSPGIIAFLSIALVIASLVATFPPFFEMISGH